MKPNWHIPKEIQQLLSSEVHVWRIYLPDFNNRLEQYWQLLNLTEQEQAKKFIQKKHQERFIIIHGILRQILGDYLNISPTKIVFTNNSFGKPQISNSDINFNISHSHDVALFAFTKHSAIGIDIEFKRDDIEIEEIAKRFFAPKENDSLNSLPPEQKLTGFFTYWTCKEAFIKAIGKGLSYPLTNFEVDINTFKLNINDPQYQTTNWSLIKINTFPDYSAALVVAGDVAKIEFFDLKESIPFLYDEIDHSVNGFSKC